MNSSIISMDQVDRASFKPGPCPHDGDAVVVKIGNQKPKHAGTSDSVLLSGQWLLSSGGTEDERLTGGWDDGVSANVPGSVHNALYDAGMIKDPYVGKNDVDALDVNRKTWWLMKEFELSQPESVNQLYFGGISDECTVWLNGQELGHHKGMFGSIRYDVSGLLAAESNRLIVRLDPAPYRVDTGQTDDFFAGMNIGWRDTVVFNNNYGWHYINLPTTGIWRDVRLVQEHTTRLEDPFIKTIDPQSGLVRLAVSVLALEGTGTVIGSIEPENFSGAGYDFCHELSGGNRSEEVLLEFTIPDVKLWWPVDIGEPNLYRLTLSLTADGKSIGNSVSTVFGVRTVDMEPGKNGPKEDEYNWKFVINGRPMFVKGANWCTLDAMMRFEKDRYDRFLSLARDSHIQMLRPWGSGMVETDEFYDLADRYGILVMQEWPTAWNSHKDQPYDLLEETVRDNTLRLRNHPSLVMWGGGNESSDPTGDAIDMMGRLSYELDGTRSFHRGEPWGGSAHNYDVYWGRQPLEKNLGLIATFIGEFGLPSVPNMETVTRYMPAEEMGMWPAAHDGSFAHHMPVFNQKQGMSRVAQYALDFAAIDNMEQFVLGSQMAQATGMRHTVERMRCLWPDSTGVLYYKINDNNPATSWATVDWFGCAKIAYHVLRQSYRPVHGCILFDRLICIGESLSLPVMLLNDADCTDAMPVTVTVRAFDSRLECVEKQVYAGELSDTCVTELGRFDLSASQTNSVPLLVVIQVVQGNEIIDGTFYWLNYTGRQGSLFDLPVTKLESVMTATGVRVKNIGDLPAVGAHFQSKTESDKFSCGDSFFWLDAGDSREVSVSESSGLKVLAWNAPAALTST